MNTIIVLCDISETDKLLFAQAEKLAKVFESRLILLHVTAPNPDFVGYEAGPQHERDWRASHLKHEREYLSNCSARLKEMGLSAKALLIEGQTQSKILEEVTLLKPDFVVIGNHQHGFFYRTFIGNVSDGVVNKLNCPVLLVPLP